MIVREILLNKKKSSSAVAQWKMIMKGEMHASDKQKLPDTYINYS